MREFIRGIKGPFVGLSYFGKHKSLLVYAIIPLLVNLLVYVAVFWFFFAHTSDINHWIDKNLLWERAQEAGILGAVTGFLRNALQWVVLVFIYIAAVVLGILTFTATANILASPFNDILSEKVEEKIAGLDFPPFNFKTFIDRSLALMWLMLKRYCILLLLLVISIIFQFIPAVGSLFGLIIAALFVVDEYFDYPFSRYRIGILKRYRLFLSHFLHLLGFGITAVVFLAIPVIGIIIMPGSVVYATMFFSERLKDKLEITGSEEKK